MCSGVGAVEVVSVAQVASCSNESGSLVWEAVPARPHFCLSPNNFLTLVSERGGVSRYR